MPTVITIQDGKVRDMLGRFRDNLPEKGKKIGLKVAEVYAEETKLRLLMHKFTGEAYNSVKAIKTPDGAAVKGEKYLWYIDKGTRWHWAPKSELLVWMMAHGGVDNFKTTGASDTGAVYIHSKAYGVITDAIQMGHKRLFPTVKTEMDNFIQSKGKV